MSDVIVIFDTHGKFLGIAHDPKEQAAKQAVKMRIEDYESFLQGVPRERRHIQEAIVYGGKIVKEITT